MSDLKENKNLATDYYRRGVGNMMHTFPILVIAVGKLGCIGSATSLQRGTLIETLKKNADSSPIFSVNTESRELK